MSKAWNMHRSIRAVSINRVRRAHKVYRINVYMVQERRNMLRFSRRPAIQRVSSRLLPLVYAMLEVARAPRSAEARVLWHIMEARRL